MPVAVKLILAGGTLLNLSSVIVIVVIVVAVVNIIIIINFVIIPISIGQPCCTLLGREEELHRGNEFWPDQPPDIFIYDQPPGKHSFQQLVFNQDQQY